MRKKLVHWTSDFETTGQSNLDKDGRVRVWLWSLVRCDDFHTLHGNTIESWFKAIAENNIERIWFHNLKFDGSFILWHLTYETDYQAMEDYEVLMSQDNILYSITLKMMDKPCVIQDSLKKFPGCSVETVARLYGIEGKKDKPNFDVYRPDDYIPTEEEISYCIQDSNIMAHAMTSELNAGHTGMTLSTDAFNGVKAELGGYKAWRKFMPMLSEDDEKFVRASYKGGWVYVNPKYQNKEVRDVHVYDVNSLYPWVMHDCILPYGKMYHGKPMGGDLFVMKFTCEFELEHGFPTVQIKHSWKYLETEYLTQSNGPTELYLTSVDWQLFKENYHIWNMSEPQYISMKGGVGMLASYIDGWMKVKEDAVKDGNQAQKYIAKRWLNSPYGKTGMRGDRINKIPVMNDKNSISWQLYHSDAESIYVPYATFVCAWARNKTIRSAQAEYDHFIYADTDSIHLEGEHYSDIEVHPYNLGAWKLESISPRGKYLRAKTYLHQETDGTYSVTCAGMPDNIKREVTWNNFQIGTEFQGKIMQRMVPGGTILQPTTFQIKDMAL